MVGTLPPSLVELRRTGRFAHLRFLEDHVATGKTYKSFRYSNNLVWDTARRGRTSAPGKPDIEIGSPPEFKGEAGVWAPEEMLVAALNACMMLTFVSFAQSKRLEFVAYESATEGVLENVDGKYRIVEVSVRPTLVLRSEADIAVAQTIMAKVKENCFISNSITADVTLDPQFQLASDVAT
jgi:organic hydroperoxide reductase OsmC/OhrA